MGTNQFRTGNLVQDHDGNVIVINKIDDNIPLVEGVLLNQPNTTHSFRGEAIENIGIRLTPDILKRFGFNDETGGWYGAQGSEQHWKLGNIEFQTLGDNKYHLINRFETKFKFVHELENLYYALTGKELELK